MQTTGTSGGKAIIGGGFDIRLSSQVDLSLVLEHVGDASRRYTSSNLLGVASVTETSQNQSRTDTSCFSAVDQVGSDLNRGETPFVSLWPTAWLTQLPAQNTLGITKSWEHGLCPRNSRRDEMNHINIIGHAS